MYSIINLYFLLHDEFCLLYVPLEQLWYWWNVRVFATIAWRNATHKLTKVDENFNHSLLLFIFAAQAPIMRLCLCAPCGLDQGASANQDTGLKLQFLFLSSDTNSSFVHFFWRTEITPNFTLSYLQKCEMMYVLIILWSQEKTCSNIYDW